jgi:RNA polymerase sigma-70 factor (ECF subfamily)
MSSGEPVLRAAENVCDERLLIEAAQRDPRRFAELYENNFARVYAFIAYRVRDRAEAEDLTAEVFHDALARIGQFEWRGLPFVAWLFRIASNAIADRWQRNARRQEVPVEDLPEAGADDGTERRAMLSQLVEGLPPDQRLVILRRFVDQRSIAEIATELDRSEGAIKQLQFRALQNLRTRMRSTYE